jgi:hypothetical protein
MCSLPIQTKNRRGKKWNTETFVRRQALGEYVYTVLLFAHGSINTFVQSDISRHIDISWQLGTSGRWMALKYSMTETELHRNVITANP